MKIREIQKICAPNSCYEVNEEVCRNLSRVDECLIYHIDRDIINLNKEQNPIQNLDDVLDGATNNTSANLPNANLHYNTWPFGIPTNEIFSRFVAICREDKRLDMTFNKMLEQSNKIARAFRGRDSEKTVVLLTDKWNLKTFKRYEKEFLNFALHDGIWYIFLLVTEYGYNEIPFLPHDRRALRDFENVNIEDSMSVDEMLNLLYDMPIDYNIYGGTWSMREFEEYTFYTDKMIWNKKSLEGKIEGKIPKRALYKFLESVSWIFEHPEERITYNCKVIDASRSSLYIFGRTFNWYNVSDYDDKRIAELAAAVEKFVDACKKKIDK